MFGSALLQPVHSVCVCLSTFFIRDGLLTVNLSVPKSSILSSEQIACPSLANIVNIGVDWIYS